MNQKRKDIFQWAIVLLVISFFLAIFPLYKVLTLPSIEKWPRTEGQIVESRMPLFSSGNKVTPIIKYRHIVNGSEYFSGEIRWIGVVWTRSEAEQVVSKYQVGKTATVFYNPNNPQEAYLEPDTSIIGPYFGVIFAIVSFQVCGWGLLVFLVLTRKAADTSPMEK